MTEPSARQIKMLIESNAGTGLGPPFGVELRGAGAWKAARGLVEMGLGEIEGDPGQELPAMFWSNDEGLEIARFFMDEAA